MSNTASANEESNNIPDLLPDSHQSLLQEYFKESLNDSELQNLVLDRFREFNDPMLRAALMELIAGEDPLNKDQVRSLLHDHDQQGPLLILAGAGSGKTAVMTRRIVYLILQGVPVKNILAVTFTKEAAQEMEQRVCKLLRDSVENLGPEIRELVENVAREIPDESWISTFHSACMRILEEQLPGENRTLLERYDEAFKDGVKILEPTEERALQDKVAKQLGLANSKDDVTSKMEEFRNNLKTPDGAKAAADTSLEKKTAKFYKQYMESKREMRKMDFNDLIFFTAHLSRKDDAVCSFLQNKFRHVLIDEYQDTNISQFILASNIAQNHRRLFAVGDDNQSIYGWRGADVRNIRSFESTYPDSEIVKLEKNYRSKGMILLSANKVFEDDQTSMDKELLPTKQTDEGALAYGEKIAIFEAGDHEEELKFISHRIKTDVQDGPRTYDDFAIFYRTNKQKYPLKDHLNKKGVPFMEVGDKRFFSLNSTEYVLSIFYLLKGLHEIRTRQNEDSPIEYLKSEKPWLLEECNEAVETYFSGDFGVLEGSAKAKMEHIYDNFEFLVDDERRQEITQRFSKRDRKRLSSAIETLEELYEPLKRQEHPSNLFDQIRSICDAEQNQTVKKQLKQCQSWVEDFAPLDGFRGLERFLRTAQEQQRDPQFTPDSDEPKVQIMSLHSSKGLEFPVVFFMGLEEGTCPHKAEWRDSYQNIDEEKRLFYVGMTRAEEELYLTYSLKREISGELKRREPSRFLDLIPDEFCEKRQVDRSASSFFSDLFS